MKLGSNQFLWSITWNHFIFHSLPDTFWRALADHVQPTRQGQTLCEQVVEKPQSQLEQTQVATMLSVDHSLPALLHGWYSQEDNPVVGKEDSHQQAVDALRIWKVALAQIETAPFVVRKASLD